MDAAQETNERLVARGNPYLAAMTSYALDPGLMRWTADRALAYRFACGADALAAIRAACSPTGEFDEYLAVPYRLATPTV